MLQGFSEIAKSEDRVDFNWELLMITSVFCMLVHAWHLGEFEMRLCARFPAFKNVSKSVRYDTNCAFRECHKVEKSEHQCH